jgi:hypothetical protein
MAISPPSYPSPSRGRERVGVKNEKGDCPFSGTVPFFEGMGKEEKEPFILE